MSLVNKTSSFLRCSLPSLSRCLYSTKSEGNGSKPKKTAKKAAKAVPKAEAPQPVVPEPVAPEPEEISDNTKYLSESYLNHDALSFYDVEAQMTAKRVGQPSSKTKPAA